MTLIIGAGCEIGSLRIESERVDVVVEEGATIRMAVIDGAGK